MSKELVISAASHERRVAILEEGQLVEIYIEREKEFALVGSIYKGRVTRVLPGMQSAFVDIGLDGDAFLYVSDVFENLEDYDHGHGSEPQNFAPHYNPTQKYTQDRGGDRSGGRDFGRGDRGGDRGRSGRWGRRGGRQRGGRPQGGRNLPPSKYASPQGEQRPHDSRGYEPRGPQNRGYEPRDNRRPEGSRYGAPSAPSNPDEEPFVLPGESLAKYRNKPAAAAPVIEAEPPEAAGL